MIFEDSRYTNTDVFIKSENTENAVPLLVIREKIKFNLDNSKFHTVRRGDTIDGIAYNYYKNAQLYWAIMDANPKYLSELDIKVGDVLIIPPYEEVAKALEQN